MSFSFPYEFVKRDSQYDFVTPIINFTGNAAVLAVGGLSLGLISHVALKQMGFNEHASAVASAIPVAMEKIGALGVLGGVFAFTAIAIQIKKAL